jgi:hypothetical protein
LVYGRAVCVRRDDLAHDASRDLHPCDVGLEPVALHVAPAGTLEHCDEVIVNVTGWLLGFAAAFACGVGRVGGDARQQNGDESANAIVRSSWLPPRVEGELHQDARRTGCFEERESMDMACSVRLIARAQGVGSDPHLPYRYRTRIRRQTGHHRSKRRIRWLRSPDLTELGLSIRPVRARFRHKLTFSAANPSGSSQFEAVTCTGSS